MTDACNQAGDRASAAVDAMISDLSRTWNPTGYYYAGDMKKLVDQVNAMLTTTSQYVDTLIGSELSSDVARNFKQVKSNLQIKLAEGQPFVRALSKATSTTSVVDAPGLRTWVMQSLVKVSNAAWYIGYIACIKPVFVGIVEVVFQGVKFVYSAAKGIANAAVSAGEAVIDAASSTFSLLAWIGRNTKTIVTVMIIGVVSYAGLRVGWTVHRFRRRYGSGGHHRALPPGDIDEDDVIDVA